MKARAVSRILIVASKAEVFRYLTDLQLYSLWNPHVTKIFSDRVLTESSTYRTTGTLFGVRLNANNRVTKLIPHSELTLENDTGLLHYAVHFRLKTEEGGTLLTCSTTVSSESNAFAFTKPLLRILAEREIKANLQLLKEAVEQQLTE